MVNLPMPTDPATVSLGWKKNILYSLLPLAILAAFLEGSARLIEIWNPPRTVDIGQGFSSESHLFVPDPNDAKFMITNPNKEVSFQKQRFLATKPPDTFRIFFLGGSSVNYLNYEFPNLANRLASGFQVSNKEIKQVEIINCGGLSYGSHRLTLIANEIIAFQPNLVLLYSGHNEFEEIEQLELAKIKTIPLQRLLYKSAFCRFIRDRIASYQISDLQKSHNQRISANSIPDAAQSWNHQFSKEEIDQRMEAYRNNLLFIIRLCQDHRIPIIIGSVPSNLVKPNLPGESGKRYQEAADLIARGEYEKGAALGRTILRQTSPRHQSSDTENEILRTVARQTGVPLADVEAAVIAAEPHHVPGETLFGDHCHLNGPGNTILIATYEKEINRLLGL